MQQLAPGNATVWFHFVHCMQMNIDPLKCYSNGHCESVDDFDAALNMVLPTCARAGRVNLTEIMACANGHQGRDLQAASYKRTAATAAYGFAPAFVDGVSVDGADAFWRKSLDQLEYGTTVLSTVCSRGRWRDSPDMCEHSLEVVLDAVTKIRGRVKAW